jgi:hypothetical protein
MNHPYVSFVTMSRNDAYVPDQLTRQQASLDMLITQLEDYCLESEIIIVEWNPPRDRDYLKEVLRFPQGSTVVTVRIITVPPEYHVKYLHADKRPMHASVAINVGIRRSRGSFVLPWAQDVFYSEPVVEFLARKELSADKSYRCERYDIDPVVLADLLSDRAKFLLACSQHVVRYQSSDWCTDLPGVTPLHMSCAGDFLLLARECWEEIRGLREAPDVYSLDDDILAAVAAHSSGAREFMMTTDCRVYKIHHHANHQGRIQYMAPSFLYRILPIFRKTFGERLRRRLSLLLNFPKRRMTDAEGVVFDSVERSFLPTAQRWSKGIGPFYLNNEQWGLAGVDRAECVLCKAGWER